MLIVRNLTDSRIVREELNLFVLGKECLKQVTLLYDSDDSSESRQNSDFYHERMETEEDDGFLPRNNVDEDMDPDITSFLIISDFSSYELPFSSTRYMSKHL